MRHPNPLIVGAGPAGTAAAITLARAGLSPLLLERSRETPDALCGGFLSWNTAAHLRRLGIDVAALGAPTITRVALFAGRRHSGSRLPHLSYALSRRTLDRALLRQAEAAGARIERGVHVAAVEPHAAVLADRSRIDAAAVVLATGKHDLRDTARARPERDPAIGLRWRLPAGPAVAALVGDAVELHLFDGGYAGLALQEDGTANLCLAVRRRLLSAAGGDPEALLARLAGDKPQLGRRLDAAGGTIGKVQGIANIPYGWLAGPDTHAPYRVGDQAAVIPSLAGEGIAIALASGAAAAGAILAGRPPATYQRTQRRVCRRPVGIAGAIWRVADHKRGARALVGAAALLPGSAALVAALCRV